MRRRRIRVATEIILGFSGLLMLAAAVFAYQLNLDNNPQMGSKRKMLALAGAGCMVLAGGSVALSSDRGLGAVGALEKTASQAGRLMDGLSASPALQRLAHAWRRAHAQRANASRFGRLVDRHPEIWAAAGVLLVILVYAWYLTGGLWAVTPYSRYFDRQADAYLTGSLALLEQPSAQLAALENPYVYEHREGVAYLWDASYYQGKYYLYWGPVPALLAAAVKGFHPAVVEDQHLLIFFLSGLAAVLAALLHWLRKTFFPQAPALTVLLLTLVGGLSVPMLWLANRPGVYETAIAGGEFFLLLGVYAALCGMAGRNGKAWLAAAGLAWGASVGCRVNNAFAAAWMVGLMGLYWLLHARKARDWLVPAACLGLPLLLWAGGLGWYNLARFGSVLETGHRYQLTGAALPAEYSLVVSPRYIIPNLYNYLFRPLEFSWQDFPFVFAPFIKETMWPWFIRLPQFYYSTEPVAGIFLAVPFFWLALLPALRPLRAGWRWVNERAGEPSEPRQPLLAWVQWLVTGAALANLAGLTVFISSTMRYLADVVPLLTVSTAVFIWWELGTLRQRPGQRRLLLAVMLLLGLASVAVAVMLNFHVGDHRFEAINPRLYFNIARFFLGTNP